MDVRCLTRFAKLLALSGLEGLFWLSIKKRRTYRTSRPKRNKIPEAEGIEKEIVRWSLRTYETKEGGIDSVDAMVSGETFMLETQVYVAFVVRFEGLQIAIKLSAGMR